MSDGYGYSDELSQPLRGGGGGQTAAGTGYEPGDQSVYRPEAAAASTQGISVVKWVGLGLAGAFALTSVILLVVYGIINKEFTNFVLAAVIVGLTFLVWLLWRWSLAPDVEAKFNYIVLAGFVLLMVLCVFAVLVIAVPPSQNSCRKVCAKMAASANVTDINATTPVTTPMLFTTVPSIRCLDPLLPLYNFSSSTCVSCNGNNRTNFTRSTPPDFRRSAPPAPLQASLASLANAAQADLLALLHASLLSDPSSLDSLIPVLSDFSHFIQSSRAVTAESPASSSPDGPLPRVSIPLSP